MLAGEARLLILTGGEPGPGDSATSLRDVAIRLGVPPEAIRMEQVSTSTHESLVAIRPILERESVRSLVVVTSPYHQRRAIWAARRTLPGIEIVSRPADPSGWQPEGWWKTTWNRRIVARGVPEARLLHLAGLGLSAGQPREARISLIQRKLD